MLDLIPIDDDERLCQPDIFFQMIMFFPDVFQRILSYTDISDSGALMLVNTELRDFISSNVSLIYGWISRNLSRIGITLDLRHTSLQFLSILKYIDLTTGVKKYLDRNTLIILLPFTNEYYFIDVSTKNGFRKNSNLVEEGTFSLSYNEIGRDFSDISWMNPGEIKLSSGSSKRLIGNGFDGEIYRRKKVGFGTEYYSVRSFGSFQHIYTGNFREDMKFGNGVLEIKLENDIILYGFWNSNKIQTLHGFRIYRFMEYKDLILDNFKGNTSEFDRMYSLTLDGPGIFQLRAGYPVIHGVWRHGRLINFVDPITANFCTRGQYIISGTDVFYCVDCSVIVCKNCHLTLHRKHFGVIRWSQEIAPDCEGK